jgi:p-aminobenzoyl-glutamate transporter AbgT
MLPYSLGILLASIVMLGSWITLGWPVGIDAGISYDPPRQP